MSLTKEMRHLPLYILLRGIVTEQTISPLSGMGHEALVVSDGVTAERWQAICAVVRMKFRYADFPLYEKRPGKGWKTIK
jgi:hypothetical protein